MTCSKLNLCLSPGPGPTEAHAGTTPALVPAPTDAVPGADPVAGNTAAVGAIAAPPCQTDADTLATGYVGPFIHAWLEIPMGLVVCEFEM